MVKKRKGFFAKPRRPLFLGRWLDVLGVKAVEVAAAVEVTESYLSELIAGTEKVNPSSALMLEISEYLNVSVNQLYRPPPSREVVEALRAMGPDIAGRLAQERPPGKGR